MIIVDLSYENPNVFYELGMAVALKKKILPICYLHKYYEEKNDQKWSSAENLPVCSLRKHHEKKNDIRNFRWKETLMKFYSINRLEPESKDLKYYTDYDEELNNYPYQKNIFVDGEKVGEKQAVPIGVRIRERLNKTLSNLNTLMVYNLTGFMEGDICECIDNYTKIVEKVCREMRCPGDRICLMYSDKQLNVVDRDSSLQETVEYSFGDICRLAINQGLHDIESKEKYGDPFNKPERLVRNYSYNRTQKVKLEYPVLVDNFFNHIFYEVKELYGSCEAEKGEYFTYLDVMLANAANCNIAFLDFRDNSDESLFWLGIYHGSGRFAVPLRYEKTKENETEKQQPVDVAGLWNAYYFSENSEEFRRCIRLVLANIYEKRGHLKYYEKRIFLSELNSNEPRDKEEGYWEVYKQNKEYFEEFYKRIFWEAMLEMGNVDVHPSPKGDKELPAQYISNWEYDGASLIIGYLNGVSHVYSTNFKNVSLMKRESEEEQSKIWKMAKHSCISMGDREVNHVTADILKPYDEYLYAMVKCDRCENNGNICPVCKRKESSKNMCPGSCKRTTRKDGEKLLKHRGFCCEEHTYTSPFLTRDELKDKEFVNQELTLYGHLVIVRENRQNIYRVCLEGSSGPATAGLAQVLASGSEKSCCYFFSEIQWSFLEYYGGELSWRIKEKGNYEKYLESLVHYMCCSLCNCFLPLISMDYLVALKKRAWGFIFSPEFVKLEDEDSQDEVKREIKREERAGNLWEIVDSWIEWIGGHRCVEAIVEVKVKSNYLQEENLDSRLIEQISLLPESLSVVRESEIEEGHIILERFALPPKSLL